MKSLPLHERLIDFHHKPHETVANISWSKWIWPVKCANDLGADAFLLWRNRANLSIAGAAKALGKTPRMIRFLDRGDYQPTESTLLLMNALAQGFDPKPWRP